MRLSRVESIKLIMLAKLLGRRFKLNRDILAVEHIDGRRSIVTLSDGEIIKIAAEPETGDLMVDVLWNGRMVGMFAIDLVREVGLTD